MDYYNTPKYHLIIFKNMLQLIGKYDIKPTIKDCPIDLQLLSNPYLKLNR